MSMVQAIETGRRAALEDRPRAIINPILAYEAMRPHPMQGAISLKGSPLPGQPGYPNAGNAAAAAFGGGGGSPASNPAAIHAQAASAVLEEKRLELEKRKQALEEAKFLETQATGAMARSQAIDTQHQKGVEASQASEKFGQETYKFNREKDIAARRDAMPALMQGIYGKNPVIVKDFINKNGNPQSKVADVKFATQRGPNGEPIVLDQKNPDSVMVTYEDGSTSFFKDTRW